jgi:hypothetical protein
MNKLATINKGNPRDLYTAIPIQIIPVIEKKTSMLVGNPALFEISSL